MPRKPSKPTDPWADLMQQELREVASPPVGALTFDQITATRKSCGLTHGQVSVHRFLREAIKSGKIKRIEGAFKDASRGHPVRQTYYLLT